MKPYAQFMAGLIFLALMTAALPQSAGAGTPVEISTLEQLQHIGDDAKTMAGHYILINDIDASDTQNWNNESGTPKGFAPIGYNFSFWFRSYIIFKEMERWIIW